MNNEANKATSKPSRNASNASKPRGTSSTPAKEPVPADRGSLEAQRAENEGMIAPDPDQLEGEGSYTAARRYDEGVARSVGEGDTKRLADEAASALDGPEGDKLRAAEKAAKQGHTK